MGARTPVIWPLDIDGHIAPFSRRDPANQIVETGFEDHGSIVLNPSINARIVGLVKSRRVEARWLTAWEDDANRLFAHRIGLPPLPTYVAGRTTGWWKVAHLDHILSTGPASVVFGDDEMNDWPGPDGRPARQYLADTWGGRIHLILPDPHIGLTHDHLDEIEAFIETPVVAPTA